MSYESLSPSAIQALCVLSISALLFPFVLKREVKGLNAGALIMFASIILVIFLVAIAYITNYRDIRQRNPHSNFSIPLWPTFNPTKTIGKFLVLLYSPTCLQTALLILYSRKKLTYKSGFIPIVCSLGFTFLAFCSISISVMYLYGDLIITQDTFLKVMSH